MKQLLRAHFSNLRKSISESRRKEASEQLCNVLFSHLSTYRYVASFCSFNDEIDLTSFNLKLAKQNRLLLPKRDKQSLRYYHISNIGFFETKQDLLIEPSKEFYQAVELTNEDVILVPGLAFDSEGFRLGYGKGYYDRFLSEFPSIQTIGIGFLEQKSTQLLPTNTWDISVNTLMLF